VRVRVSVCVLVNERLYERVCVMRVKVCVLVSVKAGRSGLV